MQQLHLTTASLSGFRLKGLLYLVDFPFQPLSTVAFSSHTVSCVNLHPLQYQNFHLRADPENNFLSHCDRPSRWLAHFRRRVFLFGYLLSPEKKCFQSSSVLSFVGSALQEPAAQAPNGRLGKFYRAPRHLVCFKFVYLFGPLGQQCFFFVFLYLFCLLAQFAWLIGNRFHLVCHRLLVLRAAATNF